MARARDNAGDGEAPAADPHYLDKLIAEQRAINGPYLSALLDDYAAATEIYTDDELEQMIAAQRQRDNADPPATFPVESLFVILPALGLLAVALLDRAH